MAGAATSAADFEALFGALEEDAIMLRGEAAEPVDASDAVLHKVRYWTEEVKKHREGRVSDYMTRLCVAVLAFGRVRHNIVR